MRKGQRREKCGVELLMLRWEALYSQSLVIGIEHALDCCELLDLLALGHDGRSEEDWVLVMETKGGLD